MEKLYIDSDVLVSFFIGDLSTFLEGFQGYMRFLKREKRQDHKFLIMANIEWFPFIEDMVSFHVDLPDFFKELNLTPKNYEAVQGNESFTDPTIYKELIEFLGQFYNKDKAVELWTPRGDSAILKTQAQSFCNDNIVAEIFDKPTITIIHDPRVKDEIWNDLIDDLKNDYNIVIFGEYSNSNAISLIDIEELGKASKGSVVTITLDNDYALVPSVIKSNSFTIGHNGDHLINIHKKLKIPIAYKTVKDFDEITSDSIITEVRQATDKFIKIGKTK